jgi:protein involved in ribonucleotide reduction
MFKIADKYALEDDTLREKLGVPWRHMIEQLAEMKSTMTVRTSVDRMHKGHNASKSQRWPTWSQEGLAKM